MIANKISSGISHLEDLPLTLLIDTLHNLHEHEITEKVDGAQILFGIDENGFYTSRESKGGCRKYNESEYGFGFHETYMRSAHKLLEQELDKIKVAGLCSGDQVEAEVLYGEFPNVVPYSANTNYIILLRTTTGKVRIDKLTDALNGLSTPVSLSVPHTNDGKTIYFLEETNTWQFAQVPEIHIDIPNIQRLIKKELQELVQYLDQPSGIDTLTNASVERLPLNKRPQWCDPNSWKNVKEQIRDKRTELLIQLNQHFIPAIKSILLTHLVHSQYSSFGPSLESGGWIEGVVIRHKTTGHMIKIVDKSQFGTTRVLLWKTRNDLIERPRCTTSQLSFIGQLQVGMASVLGYPVLGTMQARQFLRKIGTNADDQLTVLTDGIDLKKVKAEWSVLFRDMGNDLLLRLEQYLNNQTPNLSIDKRTKEVFASLFQKLKNLEINMDKITTPKELFYLLNDTLWN